MGESKITDRCSSNSNDSDDITVNIKVTLRFIDRPVRINHLELLRVEVSILSIFCTVCSEGRLRNCLKLLLRGLRRGPLGTPG